ncbi:MAG TPA: OsmC family protein [Ramlibacter sp.]
MHPYPHHYRAQAEGSATGSVRVAGKSLPALETYPPPEFDGPSGYWSPETLLVASIADCYILSFRAVARASQLEWESLSVEVEGVLDRVAGATRFVEFKLSPRLSICSRDREPLARTVLEKSKRACLITNSMSGECELLPEISVCECASESEAA